MFQMLSKEFDFNVEGFDFNAVKGVHVFQEALIRKFRLKTIEWSIEQKQPDAEVPYDS